MNAIQIIAIIQSFTILVLVMFLRRSKSVDAGAVSSTPTMKFKTKKRKPVVMDDQRAYEMEKDSKGL